MGWFPLVPTALSIEKRFLFFDDLCIEFSEFTVDEVDLTDGLLVFEGHFGIEGVHAAVEFELYLHFLAEEFFPAKDGAMEVFVKDPLAFEFVGLQFLGLGLDGEDPAVDEKFR